jgi:hypothetical protein
VLCGALPRSSFLVFAFIERVFDREATKCLCLLAE